MKKIFKLFLLSFYLINGLYATPIEIGMAIPDFSIPLVNQSDRIDQASLKDKITIIEFWATWCSPCIGGMQHLDELRAQYPADLQVIAVSQESFERVRSFIQQKDFDFLYAIDSEDVLNNYFPHRIIPHSIIIDQQGVVRAITKPSDIKPETIQQLITRKDIHLPLKAENTSFDYFADYFKADTNTLEKFEIQPSIPGIGTFSKNPNSGPFAGRRISLHNYMIDDMYRTAYQTSIYRMLYEMDKAQFDYENPKHKFCLDLIVKPEEQALLYPMLIEELEKTFPIKTRLEQKTLDVAVLFRIDSIPVQLLPGTSGDQMTARGDYYKNSNASFEDLSSYLEDYGIVGLPVLNETGDSNAYQIDFSFSPEEKGSFQAALREMGLGIKRAQRVIEVLILSEE
ncbi:MAG: redoxin domain-containing protein [Saprospiraceae bacterium]